MLDSYPTEFFNTSRSAVFHINSGANIHATNDPQDCTIFYSIKSDINLAIGSKAKCEGIGAIITQLTPNSSPILLTPVYYCPTGQISTMSPSIIHSSSNIISQPTIACMTSRGINVQYIHQKFDHHNLSIINKMKNLNLMTGMPTKIPNFHYSYDCPICLLSKATKVPRTPYQYKEHYISGEFFCLDFSFWNVISIRGFTSSLSAICMKTRYSFVFPTRNKRPPLATITWFIQTLHRQGYPVLYIQIDKGGELGRSTDF